MCGIVGAISRRDVVPVLLDGLRRLEYRGYDSAGLAVLGEDGKLYRERETGKVIELERAVDASGLKGQIGISHTRWATHGKVTQSNAHPHVCGGHVAVVHNGIIENFQALRKQQAAQGYTFTSETDTEVIVHQIHHYLEAEKDLLQAVKKAVADLDGAYGLGVIADSEPNRLIAARKSSPLIIGLGDGEYFIASDMAALIAVAREYIVLESGDIAELTLDGVR
ncbi:MAG: glutamine--fructose-6-phosphate aminotransferase, partial [Gammaproteobacteria bacterium]